VSFKNIRIKKPGGGTRLQRVKVLASGKYKFVKNLTKSKSRTTKSKTTRRKKRNNPVRRVNRTARRRRRNRKGGSNLQAKIFKWIRFGALVAPAAYTAMQHKGDMQHAIEHGLYRYTGWSGDRQTWEWQGLLEGWGPFLGACLATYGIPKLMGIIRRL